mgnify:FL=1|jgi:hypothetical protein
MITSFFRHIALLLTFRHTGCGLPGAPSAKGLNMVCLGWALLAVSVRWFAYGPYVLEDDWAIGVLVGYTLPALLTLLFKGWPVGVGYLLIVGAVEWLIVLATWLQVPMWIYGLLLAWTPAAALKLFWSWQRNKRVSA